MRYQQMSTRILATLLCAWACVPTALASGAGSPDTERVDSQFTIVARASNLFGASGPNAMTIDIKPGDAKNIVRASSGRVISVAILGSGELDVIEINPRTIRLNGVDVMLVGKSDKSLCRRMDLNEDGYEDLVCDVRTTGFKVGEGEFRITLKAATYHGESLTGEDVIRVVRD